MNITNFSELDLTPSIAKAIDEMGFNAPTEIQGKVIPLISGGMDVIGRSQTGTGKTVAFAVPAIESILTSYNVKLTAQVLVLCPTRELCQQVCDEMRKLTKYTQGIKIAEVYGGDSMVRQITQLKTANIVVGTPGRIMDHMRRRTLRLSNIHMVILDEADEMLSMGFVEDIETILAEAPETRQTVLFSATMPRSILELTKKIQNEPVMVEVENAQDPLDNITQVYTEVPMGRKMDALALLLKYYSPEKAIIFCNTKKMVDDITEKLSEYNFSIQGLHGDMKQSQRTQVMDSFKSGRVNVLTATDVAARGIDVKNVEYVINYDIPQTNEYYIHRIGRTGRAGKKGIAITICSGRRQIALFKQVLRETKSEAEEVSIPTVAQIKEKYHMQEIEKINAILAEESEEQYDKIVDSLLSKDISLHKLASNLIKLQMSSKSMDLTKFEEIGNIKARPQNGEAQNGYAKIIFNIGRSCRIAPNHIVGAITEKMNIRGSKIGKIEIYDDYSTVEVPEVMAPEIAESMTGSKIAGKFVNAQIMIENIGKKRHNDRASERNDKKSFGRKSSDKKFFGKGKEEGRRSKDGFKSRKNNGFKDHKDHKAGKNPAKKRRK